MVINLKERHKGFLLLLPALLIMSLFTIYPLFEGLRMAFTNTHLLKKSSEYVGLNNFVRLYSDEVFWISLYHSIVLTVAVILLQLALGLILGWTIQQELPGMSLFKSVIMASWVIPVAATVIMFKFIPKDIVKLSYATKYHEKFSTIMRLHSNMIDYRIVMCKNAIFVQ